MPWSAVENILRRLKENSQTPDPRPVLDVIARASQEVRSGIFYATVIIILVFVPLFALSGIEGRLFVPLGIAFIVSILASLLTSITLTPVLAYYFLAAPQGHGEAATASLVRQLKAGNTRLLHWAFRRTRRPCSPPSRSACWRPGVGAFLLPRASCRRSTKAPSSSTCSTTPASRSPSRTGSGAIAERLIMTIPEVKSLGRRTGRAELDEHAEGVHNSEIDVDLARSQRSKEEVYAHIRAKLAVLPVVGRHRPADRASPRPHAFGRSGADRHQDLRRGSRHAASAGRALRARLQAVPGLVDLQVEKQVLIPQLKVTPDYERAALYGITPAALTEALEGLSSGRVVSQIVEGNRRFDVVMRISDENRSTTGLQDLLVSTPQGLRAAAPAGQGRGRRRPQPDPARERAAAHRRARQRRRQARHGGDRCRHAASHRRYAAAVGLHDPARRHLQRPRRKPRSSSASCRSCRSR